MSYFQSISEHNKDLAAQRSAAGTLMPSLPQALPNVKVIIIGCADMRVDPAHVLLTRPCHAHFSLKAVASGHFFGFALYLDRSRDARPLPRGLTGHVAHPLRSILHCGLTCRS